MRLPKPSGQLVTCSLESDWKMPSTRSAKNLVRLASKSIKVDLTVCSSNSGACFSRICSYHSCRRRLEEHTSELQSLMRISYAVFCLKYNTKYTLKVELRHNYITYITIK